MTLNSPIAAEVRKDDGASFRVLPFRIVLIWTLLLALRAIALVTGLDRLPLVPAAPPEVIINDPAVALSRGFGLAAFSFEHSLNHLNILYANFPPLYIALQALIFRTMGLSAATLRVPGVLFDLAACVFFLLVLREFYGRGIVDRLGVTIAGTLLLLEPITLIHDRSGRMESLCLLFGSLSLYLCARSDRGVGPGQILLLRCAAAIAAGLALSTHFESLAICAVLALWSTAWIRRMRFGWVALNALPLVVLFAAWGIAYRSQAMQAFHELRQLAVYAPKSSLDLGGLIGSIASRNPRVTIQAGSPALVLILAALALGAVRLIVISVQRVPAEEPAEWRSALLRFTAIVLVQCALIQFIIPGPGGTRINVIIPFAVICLGIAISYLSNWPRKVAISGAALFVLLQLAITAAYLGELRNSWQARSPQRYDTLVDAIPANATVVAVPEFWFAFQSHNRRLALIYHADDEYKYWSDNPAAFDPYDVVILDPETPEYNALHARAREGRPVEYLLNTQGRRFTVDARSLDMTRLKDHSTN
jgi:hypothetical protein